MIENIQHFKFTKKPSKKATILHNSRNIKNNGNILSIREKEKQYSQLFIKILNSNKSSLNKNGNIKKDKNKHVHQRNIIKKISLFSNEELKYRKIYNTQCNNHTINGPEINNATSEKKIFKSKIICIKNNNKTMKKQNNLRNISKNKNKAGNNTYVNSSLLSDNQKQNNTFQCIYNNDKEKEKEPLNKMEKNNTEQNFKKGFFLKKQNEENKKHYKLESQNKKKFKPSYLNEKLSKKKSKLKIDLLNDKNVKTIAHKANEQLNYILIKKLPARYELKNTNTSPNVSFIPHKNITYLAKNENFGKQGTKESINIIDSYSNINCKKTNIYNKFNSNGKFIFTDISQSLPKIKISHNNTTDMNTTKSSGVKDYSSPFELRKKDVKQINLNSAFKDKILLSNKSREIKIIKSSNFLKYQKIPKSTLNKKKDKFNKRQIIRINIRDKLYNTKTENYNGNNPINLNLNYYPDNESPFNDKESLNTKYFKNNSLIKNKYYTKKNIQSFSLERSLKKRHETVKNNIDNIGKKLLILVNEFHNGGNNDNDKTFTFHSRKLIDRIRTFKKLNNI